jgi:hypothetical protein
VRDLLFHIFLIERAYARVLQNEAWEGEWQKSRAKLHHHFGSQPDDRWYGKKVLNLHRDSQYAPMRTNGYIPASADIKQIGSTISCSAKPFNPKSIQSGVSTSGLIFESALLSAPRLVSRPLFLSPGGFPP